MKMLLKHVNLTIESIDKCVRFLTTAFPDFKIRGRGVVEGKPWVQLRTADTYIALNESNVDRSVRGPLKHLGFVVDDVDALADRLLAAGYREGIIAPSHSDRK